MDINEALAGAALPEKTVPVCLRGDLQVQFEALEKRLDEAMRGRSDSLASGSTVRDLAEQIEALRTEMTAHTFEFRLRAKGRRTWQKLMDSHPPRPDSDSDRAIGVNEATFYDALIRESTVEPVLSGEQWTLLLDEQLTSLQFDRLATTAWSLNRRDVDVPFSHTASQVLRSTEPG